MPVITHFFWVTLLIDVSPFANDILQMVELQEHWLKIFLPKEALDLGQAYATESLVEKIKEP
jgi:hypothetical protein